MAKQNVVVRRLSAIEDLGNIEVLCTDKTGTLTQGKVVLIKHVDIKGEDSARVLEYAYLNSFFQTGLQNMLDEAVLNHDAKVKSVAKKYEKIDEIPFDFKRRRMSVAVQDCEGKHVLICKGAVEEVLAACTKVQVGNRAMALDKTHHDSKDDLVQKLSSEGFRLIALASKSVPTAKSTYSVVDESGLTLLGFLAFLDPPKVSAANAIKELQNHGVKVKILTGDNELVTRKICKEVKLEITGYLKGNEIENMDDAALQKAVEIANVFDKLEPAHKSRVIQALQKNGHVVGFMGDGINDAPALEAADVGISVEGAVDVAKESSDIILLEKSLMILKEGVLEGRRAFGNITKYIKMTASSNFGNMFSVVGGSIFLPFLPMLPLQIIINNLMYDFSQVSIPTDSVDEDYLLKPRQWRISNLARFVLFIGPLSSIFDYGTYFVMLYVFNCWGNPTLFHTGWFVESLITQTLIVHIIRTKKIPFLQSSASLPLTLTTLAIVAFGIWLPFSPLASTFGFAPLPALFWLILAGFLLTYFLITQFVKNWFVQRYGWD